MPLCRFAARSGLVFAVLLPCLACGTDPPAPPVRSASVVHGSTAAGRSSAPGGGGTSLSDSALEPAAVDAAKAEDWARAESLYRELVRRQPRNAGARRGLGVALAHREKTDEAIEVLQESVRLADGAPTRLDLAATLEAVGRYPSAVPHLRKAVELAPREPAAWTGLAQALVKVDKLDSAAETLRDSRKACPACAKDDGWNHAVEDVARSAAAKADQQVTAGDLPGARRSADLAVGLRPNLPEASFALGKVARAAGDTKTAAGAFRKAVEQTSDSAADPGAGARLQLASLLIADGNGAEAVRLAEQVVAARSDDGAALDTLGRACDVTRDTACALRAYGKLVNLPAADARSKEAQDHARGRMKALKPRRRRG